LTPRERGTVTVWSRRVRGRQHGAASKPSSSWLASGASARKSSAVDCARPFA